MTNHDTEGTKNMDTIIEQNQAEQYGTDRLCEGQPVCLIVGRHFAHYLTPEQRDRQEQDAIEAMVSDCREDSQCAKGIRAYDADQITEEELMGLICGFHWSHGADRTFVSVEGWAPTCDHVNFRRGARRCSRTAKWTVTVGRVMTTVRSPRCSWHINDGTDATIIGQEGAN